MKTAVITSIARIREIVFRLWKNDKLFFEKFAVNKDAKSSIADTTKQIVTALKEEKNTRFYLLITDDGIAFGYMVLRHDINQIASYFIHPVMRTSTYLHYFVTEYERLLNKTLNISVMMYQKNSKARNFFSKNGFVEYQQTENELNSLSAENVTLMIKQAHSDIVNV